MKFGKTLLLLVATLFLVTGCGDDKQTLDGDKDKETDKNNGVLVCTKSSVEDGIPTEEEIKVTYKDNIVTIVENYIIQDVDSEEVADLALESIKGTTEIFNGLDGISMKYEKYEKTKLKMTMSVDYTKVNEAQLREKLGEDFDENDFLKDMNTTIEDFKKENLDGYTCK